MKRFIPLAFIATLTGCTAQQLQTANGLVTVELGALTQVVNGLPDTDPHKAGYQKWLAIAQVSQTEAAALAANVSQYVATVLATTQPSN